MHSLLGGVKGHSVMLLHEIINEVSGIHTANHKGWAFVLFTNSDVAQLAAEAMDGYLMYEKRLQCEVIKNKDFPLCLRKGPRLIRPPVKNARTKRHALKLNKKQSGWNEEAAKDRLKKSLNKKAAKFAELGYQLPPVIGLSDIKPPVLPTTSAAVPSKVEEVNVEDVETGVIGKRLSELKKKPVEKKTRISGSEKLTKVIKTGKRK